MSGRGDPIILGIIGFGMGLVMLYAGIKQYLLRQKISDTPTSKVRSVAMGAVEVYGKIEPLYPLTSPAEQLPCAYYRTKLFKWVHSGKHSHWSLVKSEIKGSHFIIEDETGSIIVDSEGAELVIPVDFTFETSGQDEAKLPANVENLFKAWGVTYQYKKQLFGLITPRERLKVVEYRLSPGDNVFVFGTAQPMQPDLQKDASRVDMKGAIIAQKKGEFFYISDSPEKNILNSLRNQVLLLLGLGIAFSCGGLAIILWRLGVA